MLDILVVSPSHPSVLTGPQRKFCEGIVQGMNATQAYAEAYPQAGEESARKSGSRLLGKPEIQAEITTLREKAEAQAGSAVMTLLERRAFLAAIVRTPVGQVKEDSPLAEEMKVDAKGGVTVKLPCKLRALELDAKLAGELNPERDKERERDQERERLKAEGNSMAGPLEHALRQIWDLTHAAEG